MKFVRLEDAKEPPTPTFPADNLYQTDWVFRELQEAIAENRRQEEVMRTLAEINELRQSSHEGQ